MNNLNFCVRSIGSESSVSLSSDTNFPSPSALRRINEGPSQPQVTASAAHQPPPQTASNSPKQAKKTAIQSRLASPKRSPKLQRGKFQTNSDLLYPHLLEWISKKFSIMCVKMPKSVLTHGGHRKNFQERIWLIYGYLLFR